jgi:outer membrane protein assembly factor BamB
MSSTTTRSSLSQRPHRALRLVFVAGLALLTPLVWVSGPGDTVLAAGAQLQLTPDNNSQWALPNDTAIHREVLAKNTGSSLGVWYMATETSTGGDIICMPQPGFLYLAPGESERIECAADINLIDPSSSNWLPGQTHAVGVTLQFYADDTSGDTTSVPPNATLVLNNTVDGGWPPLVAPGQPSAPPAPPPCHAPCTPIGASPPPNDQPQITPTPVPPPQPRSGASSPPPMTDTPQPGSVATPFPNPPQATSPTPVPDNTPHNAALAIRVVDAAGKPIPDAQIQASNEESRWQTTSIADGNGRVALPVEAHLRPFSKTWQQFNLVVSASGYADAYLLESPQSGQTLPLTVSLHGPTVTANYQQVLDFDTGMPPARSAVSADGRYLVTVSYEDSPLPASYIESHSYVDYFDLQTGTHLWRYLLGSTVLGVDISADGQYVAVPYQGSVTQQSAKDYVLLLDHTGQVVWKYQTDASNGTPIPVSWAGLSTTAPLFGGAYNVKFSPDGHSLAYGTINGLIVVLNTQTHAVQTQTFVREQVRQLAWSSDSSRLYASAGDNNVYAIDAATGNILWQTDVGGWALDWSISQDYALVSAKEGYAISLVRLSDGKLLWQYPTLDVSFALAISPDQTHFISAIDNGTAPGVAVFDLSGNVVWSVGEDAVAAAWSGNSRYAAVIENIPQSTGPSTAASGPPPTIDSVNLFTNGGELVWSRVLDTPNGPWDHGEAGVTYLSQDGSTLVVGDSANGHVYIFKGTPATLATPTTAPKPSGTLAAPVSAKPAGSPPVIAGIILLVALATISSAFFLRRRRR